MKVHFPTSFCNKTEKQVKFLDYLDKVYTHYCSMMTAYYENREDDARLAYSLMVGTVLLLNSSLGIFDHSTHESYKPYKPLK